MRKAILLAAMVAIAALMMAAAPAFADEEHPGGGPCSGGSNRDEPCGNPVPGCENPGAAAHNPHCIIPDNNGNDNNGNDNNDNDNNDNDNNDNNRFCHFFDFDCNNFVFVPQFAPVVTQDLEQEAESGDIDQSFDITGGGDNSNQCVGIQGVANTGNAQNQIGVTQFGQDGDFNDFDHNRNFFHNDGFNRFDGSSGDFSVEDSGASIEVSPANTTSCDQEVNQAAAATA
jgi:hypothetical protein